MNILHARDEDAGVLPSSKLIELRELLAATRPRLLLDARFSLNACQRHQRDLIVTFARGPGERMRLSA